MQTFKRKNILLYNGVEEILLKQIDRYMDDHEVPYDWRMSLSFHVVALETKLNKGNLVQIAVIPSYQGNGHAFHGCC